MSHAALPPPLRGPVDPEQLHNGGSRKQRITAYVVLGAIFLFLSAIALGIYRQAKASAQAHQRADQLVAAFSQAGLPALDRDQVARTFGEDGGAVCANPNDALKQGIQKLAFSNGATGPGMRPVPVARNVVAGEALILAVYCPEELPSYQQYVEQLKFANVVKE
jgi:hypothetical protein